MTLSLFAICLRFPVICLADEIALGARRNCCGELMLVSEYVLVDYPEVKSISNLFVVQCWFRVELMFCSNCGRLHCEQMKVRFGDAM